MARAKKAAADKGVDTGGRGAGGRRSGAGKRRPKAKKTVRARYDEWMESHPGLASVMVGASVAAGLVGLFLFVTFSGFGSSAEFIYNQF